MKQVVIRAIPGIPTVFDFIPGHLEDGTFNPSEIDDSEFPIPPYVHDSNLLGTRAYVEATNLTDLFNYYCIRSSNIQFLSGYIVFTLQSPHHETEESTED